MSNYTTTLKRWRDKFVMKSGMPIYMVANRATLTEIATYLPLNKKDLMQISGFGKAKVDKYGDDILQAVQDYCSASNVPTNMSAKKEIQRENGKKRMMKQNLILKPFPTICSKKENRFRKLPKKEILQSVPLKVTLHGL